MPKRWILLVVMMLAAALFVVACGDDDGGNEAVTAPPSTSTLSPGGETPAPSAAVTAAGTPAAIDPCTLRTALDGRALASGPSFELSDDALWQMCIGGAAAGSSEKYLFGTEDGGTNWTLLSMTTLGNPPPQQGVGELPNGNAAEALFFIDADQGWLGLSSPGQNLFQSEDGGITWTFVDALPPGLPVTDITFSSAQNGTLTTPDGDYTTTDGGGTWNEAP